MILISNDRTSASQKINGVALIGTLTVSNTAFKRTKEEFYGFWQIELGGSTCYKLYISKASIKMIKRVRIDHSFLHSVSSLLHFVILS